MPVLIRAHKEETPVPWSHRGTSDNIGDELCDQLIVIYHLEQIDDFSPLCLMFPSSRVNTK